MGQVVVALHRATNKNIPIYMDGTDIIGRIQREMTYGLSGRKSIKSVAAESGLCTTTVSNLYHGITKAPRLSTVVALLRVFHYKLVAVPKNRDI